MIQVRWLLDIYSYSIEGYTSTFEALESREYAIFLRMAIKCSMNSRIQKLSHCSIKWYESLIKILSVSRILILDETYLITQSVLDIYIPIGF